MAFDVGLIYESILGNWLIPAVGIVAFAFGNRLSFHKAHKVWFKGTQLR